MMVVMFDPIGHLSPLVLIGAAKNPTLVMFGFDDKNSGVRDQHMINLGCPGFGWLRDVIKQDVRPGAMG